MCSCTGTLGKGSRSGRVTTSWRSLTRRRRKTRSRSTPATSTRTGRAAGCGSSTGLMWVLGSSSKNAIRRSRLSARRVRPASGLTLRALSRKRRNAFPSDCVAHPHTCNAQLCRGDSLPLWAGRDKELGMADEQTGVPEQEARNIWAWTELFRTFQVALDPKKLLLAAVGIIVMWMGWLILSVIFFNMRSEPKWPSDYPSANYKKDGMTEEQAGELARQHYDRDMERYVLLYRLAGPGDQSAPELWKRETGKLRIYPWHEDRGPNPYLLVTNQYDDKSRQELFGWWFA